LSGKKKNLLIFIKEEPKSIAKKLLSGFFLIKDKGLNILNKV